MDIVRATPLAQNLAIAILDRAGQVQYSAIHTLAAKIDTEIGLGGLELDMQYVSRPPVWPWLWPGWVAGVKAIGLAWLARIRSHD